MIGRDAEKCQIVIPHHAVSREHAKITQENGAYFIEDLKSRNHTFVNSKEVAGGRAQARRPDQDLRLPVPVPRRADPARPEPLPDWTCGRQEPKPTRNDRAG